MSTLYVTTQGAVIKKEEHRFTVKKEGKVLISIPDFRVERILIYGNVQITTQALKFAMRNDISVTFLTSRGHLIGTAIPNFSKNIFIRIKQFEKLQNVNIRLNLSKEVLIAKITNSIVMLKRYVKNVNSAPLNNITRLKSLINRIRESNSIKRLRGIEGSASYIYFSNLRNILSDLIKFEGRNFHPAKDPFNSLLNFLYSLLSNEILGIVFNKGLDPYIGFLHELEYGRTSLVFDLMEPLRGPIADAIAVKLFRKRIIKESDFEKHKIYGFILKQEVRRVVLNHYEEKMESKFKYEGMTLNFRKIIIETVNDFSNYLMDRGNFRYFRLKK